MLNKFMNFVKRLFVKKQPPIDVGVFHKNCRHEVEPFISIVWDDVNEP